MKIINVKQGSEEWLKLRLNYLCASEAAVIMGASKYMTREQLLDLKKGWKKNPDNEFLKRLYSEGHETEAMAKEILEIQELEEFPAVVGVRQVDGVEFLASFDGLSESGVVWEHKLWNKVLAENVRNGVLEPAYYWQLEQQCLVAGKNEALFWCSDGTYDNLLTMVYQSKPERRQQLIDASKQFLADLKTHELEAKQEVIVAKNLDVMTPSYEILGQVINSNIGRCIEAAKELADDEGNTPIATELDYAKANDLAKKIKVARNKLKDTLASVRNQFKSFSQFNNSAEEFDGILQKLQGSKEKSLKTYKEVKKQNLINQAKSEFNNYLNEIDLPIDIREITNVAPDYNGAVANKKTTQSMIDGLSQSVADAKVKVSKIVDIVAPNIAIYNDQYLEYDFLFRDLISIITNPAFSDIAKSRVLEHKRIEAEKIEKAKEEERKLIEAQNATEQIEQQHEAEKWVTHDESQEQKDSTAIEVKEPKIKAKTFSGNGWSNNEVKPIDAVKNKLLAAYGAHTGVELNAYEVSWLINYIIRLGKNNERN